MKDEEIYRFIRNMEWRFCPYRAYCSIQPTQGVALGCALLPLQGVKQPVNMAALHRQWSRHTSSCSNISSLGIPDNPNLFQNDFLLCRMTQGECTFTVFGCNPKASTTSCGIALNFCKLWFILIQKGREKKDGGGTLRQKGDFLGSFYSKSWSLPLFSSKMFGYSK